MIGFEIKPFDPDHLPTIASLLKMPLPQALAKFAAGVAAMVAVRCDQIIGVIRIDPVPGKPAFRIGALYVMPHFRRFRIARMLWEAAYEQLPSTTILATVNEYQVDLQLTLKAFGFRCYKQRGGALHFKRK